MKKDMPDYKVWAADINKDYSWLHDVDRMPIVVTVCDKIVELRFSMTEEVEC